MHLFIIYFLLMGQTRFTYIPYHINHWCWWSSEPSGIIVFPTFGRRRHFSIRTCELLRVGHTMNPPLYEPVSGNITIYLSAAITPARGKKPLAQKILLPAISVFSSRNVFNQKRLHRRPETVEHEQNSWLMPFSENHHLKFSHSKGANENVVSYSISANWLISRKKESRIPFPWRRKNVKQWKRLVFLFRRRGKARADRRELCQLTRLFAEMIASESGDFLRAYA